MAATELGDQYRAGKSANIYFSLFCEGQNLRGQLVNQNKGQEKANKTLRLTQGLWMFGIEEELWRNSLWTHSEMLTVVNFSTALWEMYRGKKCHFGNIDLKPAANLISIGWEKVIRNSQRSSESPWMKNKLPPVHDALLQFMKYRYPKGSDVHTGLPLNRALKE